MSEERAPEAITRFDRPRPRGSVTTEVLDDEALLHVEGRRALHVLNPTASLIWQNLDGEVSLDELAGLLSEASGASFDTVLSDVLEVVRSLGASGLLHGVITAEPVEEQENQQAVSGAAEVTGDDLRFLPEPPHG